MKVSDKNKSIATIPKETWESGIDIYQKERSRKQYLNDITTDIQGNGYPIIHENQDK